MSPPRPKHKLLPNLYFKAYCCGIILQFFIRDFLILECNVDCYIPYTTGYESNVDAELCDGWKGRYGLNHSKCANPDGGEKPWCYTKSNLLRNSWRYCESKVCSTLPPTNPNLHAVVATLSRGPVGPGDKIDEVDVNLIMKSCRSDGKLLKPDKPVTAIDLQIAAMAFTAAPFGQLWSTYTNIGDYQFGIVLASELKENDIIPVDELNVKGLKTNEYVKFENIFDIQLITNISKVTFPRLGSQQFQLSYFSPILYSSLSENITLLGELDKWVPVSNDRIQQMTILPPSDPKEDVNIELQVLGHPQENVTFTFLGMGWDIIPYKYIVNITCTIPDTGKTTMTFPQATCNA